MTSDVKDQLRQFGEWHEGRQDRVGAADVVERVRPVDLVHRTPRIRRRPGIVVAVAAFVVALVVGVPLLLSLGGDETAPADPPPVVIDNGPVTVPPDEDAPTPDAEPLGEPPTPPEALQIAPWYRVVDAEEVFDGVALRDIIEFDGRLVAVGDKDQTLAVAFTSEDGVTWSRARIEAESGSPEAGVMSVVVEAGPNLVALGANGRREFTVWTSSDGLVWSTVAQLQDVGEPVEVADVVAGGPGFVAVGYEGPGATGALGANAAAIWTSVDGLQWQRVASDSSVFGDSAEITAVAAGNGSLLAIGGIGAGPEDGCCYVWTSTDGVEWSRGNLAADEIRDVAFFEGIFATATGWSTDGATWTPYDSRFDDGDPFHPATLFEVAGERLIAEQRPGMGFPWTVHSSTDGKTWTHQGIVVPGFAAVAAGGPGMVAAGESGVAVWFDDPADADAYGALIALDAAPLPREDEAVAAEWLPFRVAAVDAMLAAYNDGRYEDWLALLGEEPDLGNGLGIDVEAALMAADGRWRRTGECAAWPGYVICDTMRSDDFYGAGGFDHNARFLFRFADRTADLIGYEVAEDLGLTDWFDEHGAFDLAFLGWLGAVHPEVSVARGTDLFGIAAADMSTALEYVGEFVAQSEKYPIGFPADR